MNDVYFHRLIKNPLFLFGAFIILCTVFITLSGAGLRPDGSPFANEQHLELMNLKPLKKVRFLKMAKDQEALDQGVFSAYFIGKNSKWNYISYDSIWLEEEYVVLRKFNETAEEKIPLGLIFQNSNTKEEFSKAIEARTEIRTYWLGSDKYGRDLLSRLMSGAYVSLSVGLISVLISLLLGIFLGTIAGYYRGWVDKVIVWFINVIWSVPTLLLVIAITLILGKGFWQIFIAVGLTMWVEVARIVRGQVMSAREKEYVEAGVVLGYSDSRIIFRHILPNIISPVIVISAANFATAILLEAGLSFLGIGVPPPQATWGKMISEHKAYIITGDAHLAIIPGIAIMLLVLSFTFIGNGLRDALDERLPENS